MSNLVSEFALGELTAEIQVETYQEPIAAGDRIVAKLRLILPNDGGSYIAPSLRFCSRLSLLEEPLTGEWGVTCSGGRIRSRVIGVFDTHAEAREQGLAAGVAEMTKLADALEARRVAAEKAGK